MAETSHLELWRARDKAANETMERFRKAAQGLRWQTQAFLEYLDGHWFEEKLRVRRIMRLCSITDKSFATYFHADLGEAPRDYIRRVKMEVAAELLRTTSYDIALIGEAVGIPAPAQFSRDFRRWFGETPGGYRDRANGAEGPVPTFHDPQFVKAAFAGELTHHEAELYVAHIHELYSLPPPTPAQVPDSIYDENLVAEVVLRRLRNKTFEEQKEIVKYQYDFRTPALFHLLLQKSRQETRRLGPQRGICWVELALVSLEDRESTLGSHIPNLQTRGWAWLGNYLRQAFDFPGAAEAFKHAELAWNVPRTIKDFSALAEMLALKAWFLYYRRSSEEALELNTLAMQLFKKMNDKKSLVQALIARGAIKSSTGHQAEGIADLEEALRIIEITKLPDMKMAAMANMVIAYTLADLTEEAQKILPETKLLIANCPHGAAGYNVLWTEGLIEKKRNRIHLAEKLFTDSRDGFTALGEADFKAAVTLDLAGLKLENGKPLEALQLAAETIPFFESFKFRDEAMAALQLVRDAMAQANLTLSTLREVRANVDQIMKDPWFGNQWLRGAMSYTEKHCPCIDI
ncbi:MAG: helix-turn-helix transcriptional regulator [bacterium]|nr:helix-turn-helix transcriptional regulator [bacterium]